MSGHALWYLTRGTGLTALVLVTLSVLAGIAASLRAGGVRMPRFVVSGLHRNLSLLTVVFIIVHVVTTVLDAYAPISLVDAVVPFISGYRPIWLGLGALAFDIILALVITSLVRVRIGLKTWRFVHWFAYACFPITIVHALGTGSDASQRWLLAVVMTCVGLVIAGALWRLWSIRKDHAPLALTGVATVVAVPLLMIAWATNGPLASGWAARAGTPTHLIGGRSTAAQHVSTTSSASPLPAPPYTASLSGTIAQTSPDDAGNTAITIATTTRGTTNAKLKVVLNGTSSTGEGLDTLNSSTVTYGPASNPSLYTGSVVQLSGDQLSLSVTSTAAAPADLLLNLNLQLNQSAGTVTGQLSAR
jgi:sulfoxide reductase heme-binding subunit YedZ